jgi:hypothetical protein
MIRVGCLMVLTLGLAGPSEAAAPVVKLFNGQDLDGWEGELAHWKATDGMIVGTSPGLKENHFLATKDEYGDFELRFEVRLHADGENSGVQFRSQRVPGSTEMKGYQADIGKGVWGGLYDESRRRRFLAQPDPAVVARAVKPGEWNAYVIRAVGPKVTLSINGQTMVEYTEPDPSLPQSGKIALQLHSGGPFRIDFRGLELTPLTP